MKTRLSLVLAVLWVSSQAIAQGITGWDRIGFGMSRDNVAASYPGSYWVHGQWDDRNLVLLHPRVQGVDALACGFTYDDRCYGVCVALYSPDLGMVRHELSEKYRLPCRGYSSRAGSKAYCFPCGDRAIVAFRLVREGPGDLGWFEERQKDKGIEILPGLRLRIGEPREKERHGYEGDRFFLDRAYRLFCRMQDALAGDPQDRDRLLADTYDRGGVRVVYLDNALCEAYERGRREWEEHHRHWDRDRDRDRSGKPPL